MAAALALAAIVLTRSKGGMAAAVVAVVYSGFVGLFVYRSLVDIWKRRKAELRLKVDANKGFAMAVAKATSPADVTVHGEAMAGRDAGAGVRPGARARARRARHRS